MSVHTDWESRDQSGTNKVVIRARIHQDFDGNAKYWSFFVPDAPDLLANVAVILNSGETARCVLSLSPNFLSNNGWGKAEFDSIYTREIIERGNVILPVWHNVDAKQVYEYSPKLADKVGLSSSLGVEELARKLVNAIRRDGI